MKQPICDLCGEPALNYPLPIYTDNTWTKRGDRTKIYVSLTVHIQDEGGQGRGGEGELCKKCTAKVLSATGYKRV